MHASFDGPVIMEVERIALEDEGVKAEIAKLELPEGSVIVCDPWIYGMVKSRLARLLLLTRFSYRRRRRS